MSLQDEGLPAARHAVVHLFGRCILRFQAYEILMKSMVAGHQLSAPMSQTGIAEAQADRLTEAARKTMGSLVNEMFASLLLNEGQEGSACEDRQDASPISFKSTIVFPPEEFARIEAEHRDLVIQRNNLVHHFLQLHDLQTVEGCRVALLALTTHFDCVTRAHEELLSWAKDMKRSRKIVAEYVLSPEFDDFFVHGRIPWHRVVISQGLYDAALELAKGDWLDVDTAISWMAKHYPEEQPAGYRCKSWRQVIHETGRFDLQIRKVSGRRQAWYRPRVQQ